MHPLHRLSDGKCIGHMTAPVPMLRHARSRPIHREQPLLRRICEYGGAETATGKQGGSMKTALASIALLLVLTALTVPGLAQDKLGKVTFPTSCDAKVQAQFERGVAMLHSYWFTEARKVFDAVIQQDPKCAMAYWGLAVNYLGNSLAGAPPPKDAAAAGVALDRARAIGAKTQRERDWIEAIGTYYLDHDTVPLDARLAAYTRAMEAMTQRYPDDFEAWTYYALTLQASAPKHDYHHATDFMVYAHLQLAQDAKAKRLVDGIAALTRGDYPFLANYTAVAVIPARYALERGDWAGAAALPVVATGRAMADSLVRF